MFLISLISVHKYNLSTCYGRKYTTTQWLSNVCVHVYNQHVCRRKRGRNKIKTLETLVGTTLFYHLFHHTLRSLHHPFTNPLILAQSLLDLHKTLSLSLRHTEHHKQAEQHCHNTVDVEQVRGANLSRYGREEPYAEEHEGEATELDTRHAESPGSAVEELGYQWPDH